ncbi:hypothetical protein BDM02DRAFT_1928766 [Thelephora ganbajun]|uniref:Uncharacterized protein n=1 Tax=Thelephora ganbajun TaxID=370292 RepID=A0ACB6ZHU4_THEGA|nr:hypothetical protein BDM02DRAFT_1928766 [Thelephora ganbajun]
MFARYQQEANPRGLGPPPPNAYKRAVLRDPPKQFKVSVLPPKKLGSGWAYGLHVVSAVDDEVSDRRSVSSRSASSSSSYKDYEVWRRWDDCLWFQETLELEYSIQAREKRRRLEQGKGVKKNGVYLDSKQAASFDSLPPGPDPTSVSLDIHDYIPKLSKKATLFRANQATIDQRQHQFAELINALFASEAPTLIEELRASRTFKDFFGWWRRDKDFARRHGPGKGKRPEVPILDSVPFYFDISNASQIFSAPTRSFRDLPPPRPKLTRPNTANATISDSRWNKAHSDSRDDALLRRRRTTSNTTSPPVIAVSSASIDDPHESRPGPRASLYSALSDELSPTVVMWDGQERLNASDRVSPNAVLNAFPQTPMVKETFENIQCPPSPEPDSPILGLEVLPEEPELELPLSQMSVHEHGPQTRPPIARSRGDSVSDSRHRNAIAFFPDTALGDTEVPEIPDRSPTMTNATSTSSRHSSLFSNASFAPSSRTDPPPWLSPRRSLDSCTTEAIDYSSTGSPVTPQSPWLSDSEALPTLGSSIKRDPRESIMSIDSIMSNASVDQVLPRASPRHRSQRFASMSVPEEVFPEDCDDGTLDSYLYGGCHIRSISRSLLETSVFFFVLKVSPCGYSPRRTFF